jgi:hypothetical protein
MNHRDVTTGHRLYALPMRSSMLLLAIGASALMAWQAAHAQFSIVPSPAPAAADKVSDAETPHGYRADGARHLYSRYPAHIHKGKLPPLMYAIAITETEIDENGEVVSAVVTREPAAAKEVGPWVVAMIRQAAPFPRPSRLGHVKYTDVWLVDRTGRFQLDTLSEGQQ